MSLGNEFCWFLRKSHLYNWRGKNWFVELLQVKIPNLYLQGEASFLCPFGYALVGPETIQCGPDGKWTGYVPKCKAISCPSPLPPLNGKVMDNGHYLVGNTVQYSCHEGYVLIGEPIIRCTETGLWSHAPPFCKFMHVTDIYIFARDNEPVPFSQVN